MILYNGLENPDVESDIDENPQKFGYGIIRTDKEWEEVGYISQILKNDRTTTHDADKISVVVLSPHRY